MPEDNGAEIETPKQEPTEQEIAQAKFEQQCFDDYTTLNGIARHFEATNLALSLKAKTPAAQTERHAFFDRIIHRDGPLLVEGPAWNIADKKDNNEQPEGV